MNKVLNILLWAVGAAAIFILMGFVEVENHNRKFNELSIKIDYKDHNFFVEDGDIRNIINNLGYGSNENLNEVDLVKIEEILKNNSSISGAEVYSTIDGNIMVEVSQRRPIIRIFSEAGNSYYIDDQGELMPTSNKYTSRIIVASGKIENDITSYGIELAEGKEDALTSADVNMLDQLFQLARKIDGDPFWKAQFVQVYVNEDQEIELIPSVGNHKIILGDVTDMEEKLKKLRVFYKKGLSKTGWNEYSVINLKFKDQIVCTKRYI
ncbi:MAG: cell division protein FtsQ [Flavobacteriales bacterium]|nr:cell division protein FtsQ [Flavobacteriales bacterium]